MSGNHRERISFLLIDSPHSLIILGLPWLQVHNPQINWRGERILRWSVECHALCLKSAESNAPMEGTAVKQFVQPFPDGERSNGDLYMGRSSHCTHLALLLAPWGRSIFCKKERWDTPAMYLYYRSLNRMTIRDKYPLPLIDTTFELLQGACIFTTLDPRNAYHLVSTSVETHRVHVRAVLQRLLEN